jgi:hypothetical protein
VDSFSIQPDYCILHKALPIKNAVEEFRNELGYLALPVMAKIYLNKSVSLELGHKRPFVKWK